MKWSKEHDKELLKEILFERPFEQPKGSRMIGLVWQRIVDNLNNKEFPKFVLKNIRAVRERYGVLEEKYKRKLREEVNATGISPEPDEVGQMMEEIIALFESYEEQRQKEKQERSEDQHLAEDIRLRALETFGETRRRRDDTQSDANTSDDEESPRPKRTRNRRKSQSDALEYFRSKHNSELEFKRQELDIRKQEMELRKQELELQRSQNEGLMKLLLEHVKK